MEAVVSDILQSRKHEPDGFKKTAAISFAAHAVVFAVIAVIPTVVPRAAQPRVVMTISLGGAPGPNTGGMQMIGGRAIQAAQPSTDPQLSKAIIPAVQPPPPKMALPDPKQKPKTPPKPTVTSKDPKGTNVGRGFETQAGTAKVETGARREGFGLSSGGMGGQGVQLGVTNFCCPEYIAGMLDRITKNWNQNQKVTGLVVMSYVVQSNGQITDIEVAESSGNPLLDIAAQRALVNTRMLPPLPPAFTGQRLPVRLKFEYTR
jgi:protein TonB